MCRPTRILLTSVIVVSLALFLTLILWWSFARPTERFIGIAVNSAGDHPIPLYELTYDLFGVPIAVWLTLAATPLSCLVLCRLATRCARAACDVRRRWDERRSRLCPSCGYDLRFTPHRCPECGRILTMSGYPRS